MHACGHDTHMAMLLGAARLLVDRRDELAGRVLLMFQPGEEGYHGARFMLDEGLLDECPLGAGMRDGRVRAPHHVALRRAGRIDYRGRARCSPRPTSSALTVRGRGGHASAPHQAIDPIPVAAEIVLALQTDGHPAHRRVRPGGRHDRPHQRRHHDQHHPRDGLDRGHDPDRLGRRRAPWSTPVARRGGRGSCAAHDATAELEIVPGYPVTLNDPAFTAFAAGVAAEAAGRRRT